LPEPCRKPPTRRDEGKAVRSERLHQLPFHPDYQSAFRAIVFAIIRCGFTARCALEIDNAARVRFEKICAIIRECRYSIHDISRTELSPETGLPRFNMPLELGFFLGAFTYGGRQHRAKSCLILDREQHRYRLFLSDISGQDVKAHGGETAALLSLGSDYLRTSQPDMRIPGGRKIMADFDRFTNDLPDICKEADLAEEEVNFQDYSTMAALWIAQGA
jgi:hypothetical protein